MNDDRHQGWSWVGGCGRLLYLRDTIFDSLDYLVVLYRVVVAGLVSARVRDHNDQL